MIKLNRIRNIFVLTILLSPLFSSCAEESASEREKVFPRWDTAHMTNVGESGSIFLPGKLVKSYLVKSRVFKREKKHTFAGGVSYGPGGLGALNLINKKLRNIVMDDSDKEVDLEQEIKNYFRDVGSEIADSVFSGISCPRVSCFLAHMKDPDNLYVASVGARVMIIQNGKIIFNAKRDHREFSNPEVFKHFIEAEDIVLLLTKEFEQLSDEHIIKTLSENEFKLGDLLDDMEGGGPAVLARFFCCSSVGLNEAKG
ncbi:MAG TPA: hypothetical protein ENI08_01290 [Candidatus Dependentiae bacterium]|nr:hypothetical protein [Candidatus Dependentiae bacterium]